MRPLITRAPIGSLTQGTVFNCATAFRYVGIQVYGLTITARCDVAQQKYRLLNYIPVVPVDHWLKQDGLDILNDIEERDIFGKIKNELKQNGLSPNLLLSVPLQEIIAVHFPENTNEKSVKKARERIDSFRIDREELAKIGSDNDQSLKWFVAKRPKLIRQIIKDLLDHKILGYYFLERIEPSSNITGYVCLLREASSLPREVAEAIARGLTKASWVEMCSSNESTFLDLSIEDFAMPISQIGSPYIEHIMQSYANLFIRIGVEDAREEDVDAICGRLKSGMETNR